MSQSKNQSLIRLGIIAGIVLGALLVGKLIGPDAYSLVVTILKAVGLVLLGITVLVTIHELGHFLTAKMFGMRVEAFSIGFPPKLFSFQRGDTEYQIGATPLGGYVKISGIIDESMDTEHLAQEPEPYEFRAKPVWQRLIVMTGGVIMNVILGVIIFSLLSFAFGEQKTPVNEARYGIEVIQSVQGVNKCDEPVTRTTLGHILGFRTGDRLHSFKGESLPYLEDYNNPNILLEGDGYFEVEREGSIVRLDVPEGILNAFSNDTVLVELFGINTPAQIRVYAADSALNPTNKEFPAEKAGLETGDVILSLNGIPIQWYADLLEYLPRFKNQMLPMEIRRGDTTLEVVAPMDSTGKLGITRDPSLFQDFRQDTLKYAFFESFGPGAKRAFGILSLNAKGFGKIISGNADAGSSVMGPVAIAQKYLEIFTSGGWTGFWVLTASLSMILAFVNILPIPALDGGHVVFLLIEAITRREPSPKVRIIAQQIGMILILGLMVLVIFNDFFNLGGC